jgi:acyl dehydratase
MSINQAFVGRRYEADRLFEVGREKIREFATAVGASDPAHHDEAAARALGYADILAPPTFPIILTMGLELRLMADPELGLDFTRVVHREQRFVHHRPVLAGDRLWTAVIVDAIRVAAGNDLVTTRAEVSAEDGSAVVTAYSTLVARGTADVAGGRQ